MAKKNKNLSKAKKAKNDEFYTQLSDIENEVKHYKDHLKGKSIFLNCDDHRFSNFYRYFELNFNHLGIEKLVATHYHATERAHKLVIDRDELGSMRVHKPQLLLQNGDFRSPESIELLKECDIVVTNPPFSLFREYVAQLMEYGKKFLIIGPMGAMIYKEIFPLIKDNKLWFGINNVKEFKQPDGTIKKFGNINWFTNLTHNKRNEEIKLFKKYKAEDYPKYDNYDAIEVNKLVNIPTDYDKIMGVPITFIAKYNPKQFKIIWQASGNTRASTDENILKELGYIQQKEDRGGCPVLNNERVYSRILIKLNKIKDEDNTKEDNG